MTTTTNNDSALVPFLLAVLAICALCMFGGLYSSTNGDTTEDIGPCFMEETYCENTSWAVLLHKQGPTLVDGIWACNLHKDGAENSIDVVALALTQDGRGHHYAQTVHVSDL